MQFVYFLAAALRPEARREILAGAALFALTLIVGGPATRRARAQPRRGTLYLSVRAEPGSSAQRILIRVRRIAKVPSKHSLAHFEATLASGSHTSFPSLAPGDYMVTASAPGFMTADVNLVIQPGEQQTIALVLHRKTRTAASPDGNNAASSESVSAGSMSNLPLNGRSTSSLVALEPGVIKAKTQSHGHGTRGFGTQMEIFGSRPRQNNSRLDGISVNDYANGPRGNAIGISLGVDALNQINVLTTNDEASYGRSSGGEISATTHSGTNQFHGSAFYYLRNSALDARDFFALKKPPFHRNQFGVAAGGPLWKHLYFFGDYEGIRESRGITHVSAVPSATARTGNLSTGKISVDPAVTRYLDAFYPLPNSRLLGAADTGLYVFSGQRVTPGNHFTIRIDHRFSPNSSLDGVYMLDGGSVTQPDGFDTVRNEYNSRQHFFTMNYEHAFSRHANNESRFGINRVIANTGITYPGANPAAQDTAFGILPQKDSPRIAVAALSPFGGGLDASNSYDFHWTSIQAYDNFSLQEGAHSFQLGGAFEYMRDNIVASNDPAGYFSFSSLSDFLGNRPFSFNVQVGGSSVKAFRQTRLAAYAQDNWRLLPRFVLHLGARYAMVTLPTDVHGRLSTLRALANPNPHLGSPLFANPTLRDIEPRVGFSWEPIGVSRTFVNSSFGIFDVLPLPYEIQFGELFAAPWFQSRSITNLPAGSFPQRAYELAAASTTARSAYFQPNPHRNYVMRWNIDVEHQLSRSVNVKLGYVGSHGVHQIFRVHDANIVLPAATTRGYLWPSPPGSGMRISPTLGRIESAFWIGSSSYNALVLQVRKELSSGFDVESSYTWGKSIDTSSGSISGNEYQNSISSPLWFAPRLNRGRSDFDVAQNLKILGSWKIPAPQNEAGFVRWVLSGWQLSGIVEASSGVPFTPGIAGDPLGVNSTDPGIDVPNVLSGRDCGSLVNPGSPADYIRKACFSVPHPMTLRGNAGRNILIGPGLFNLDSSLFKNNYMRRGSQEFNVQFRVEFFNLINRPNFKAPLSNRFLFDAQGNPIGSAGVIVATQTPPREIQFAIRLSW